MNYEHKPVGGINGNSIRSMSRGKWRARYLLRCSRDVIDGKHRDACAVLVRHQHVPAIIGKRSRGGAAGVRQALRSNSLPGRRIDDPGYKLVEARTELINKTTI